MSTFLQNYAVIHDLLQGGVPNTPEPLYIKKSKDSRKNYLGRAQSLPSGLNPFEDLWCIRMDIRKAILTVLSRQERTILGEFYLGSSKVDPSDLRTDEAYYVSLKTGLHPKTIRTIVDRAKAKIARYLDTNDDS